MDRAKILNLLDTLEVRIDRMEKNLALSAAKSPYAILQILVELRVISRRLRSKIDVIDTASITRLRENIDEIRTSPRRLIWIFG